MENFFYDFVFDAVPIMLGVWLVIISLKKNRKYIFFKMLAVASSIAIISHYLERLLRYLIQ